MYTDWISYTGHKQWKRTEKTRREKKTKLFSEGDFSSTGLHTWTGKLKQSVVKVGFGMWGNPKTCCIDSKWFLMLASADFLWVETVIS